MTKDSNVTISYHGIEFENAYPYLNEHIIHPIEKFLDVNFTKDYKDFLLNVNGGRPNKAAFKFINNNNGSIVQQFYGINENGNYGNLLQQYKYNRFRIPNNMIHIGSDCGGNQILLSIKNPDRGKVYFWDHELEADTDNGEVPSYDNLTLIANSFDEFLSKLYSEDDDNTV
jgi:hypothetical protein